MANGSVWDSGSIRHDGTHDGGIWSSTACVGQETLSGLGSHVQMVKRAVIFDTWEKMLATKTPCLMDLWDVDFKFDAA